MIEERISLHSTEGGSDKVYHVQLTPSADGTGWLVTAQSGPRNGNLKSQDKITAPVPYEDAHKAYKQLVKAKLAKRYNPMAGSAANALTVATRTFTNIRPQLLNEIDEGRLEHLLRDDNWFMQQKYDGDRTPIGINKMGCERPLPVCISEAVAELPVACLLDGELVGERYYAFDLMECACDTRGLALRTRLRSLASLLADLPARAQHMFPAVGVFSSEKDKREELARLRAANAEGVAFHRAASEYTEGRPASDGDHLKFKFWASCSCLVTRVNAGRRSVAVHLLDSLGGVVAVGNVTIPANHDIPPAMQTVEVRYLYAFPNGGSLFQPTYLGPRSDILESECLYSQLKFKAVGLAA